MAIDPAADAHIFFTDFAIPAVFDDGSPEGLSLDVLWEEPGTQVNLLTGAAETSAPALLVSTGNVAEFLRPDLLVTVQGKDWLVAGSRPDGSGLTRIELTEA